MLNIMPQSTGRNTRLENAWRIVTGFFNRSANISTGQTAPLVGQLGAFSSESTLSRRYDQEYLETPVRDSFRAQQLIALRKRPEVGTAIDILVGDLSSSEDGDTAGFTISPTLADGITPIDPQLLKILLACIDRLLRGTDINTIVEEFLCYGDSFRSLVLDPSYSKIIKIKQLPTWELFRVEDENGNVLRFEQRRFLGEVAQEWQIHPAVCVHWRYRRRYKYGRALFEEVIEDDLALNQAYFALDKAAMAIGINPNVHIMPNGWTDKQADAYKKSYENERDRSGRVMTDFFLLFGGEVKKLAGAWNPDLNALISNVLQRRMRIVMRSRIPPWMIGLPSQGAKDIAGQPALAYARFVGSIRTVFAEGIRQILDLELALNGYKKEEMLYQLLFPKIYTNPNIQSAEPDEPDTAGIEDLDRVTLANGAIRSTIADDLNRFSTHGEKAWNLR